MPAGAVPHQRYEAQLRESRARPGAITTHLAALQQHLEAFLGPMAFVLPDALVDTVRLDVMFWTPRPDRPFFTLITRGMSSLDMAVPPEAQVSGVSSRAELMLCLPAEWPVPGPEGGAWDQATSFVPVQWLKTIARLPHQSESWVTSMHTIPTAEPPAALSVWTQMCAWLVLPPLTLPDECLHITLPGGMRVDIFGLYAIYLDELHAKVAGEVDRLIEGFERHNVSELFDIHRPSVLSG